MKTNYFKFMLSRDKNYRNAFLLAVLLFIGGTASAVIVGCNRAFFSHLFPTCPLYYFTGLHCISCGATRATLALLRGDFITAVYYNPLYIGFLGWLGYLYARLILSLIIRPYRKYSLKPTWPWGLAVLAAVVFFVIFRNTPAYQAYLF